MPHLIWALARLFSNLFAGLPYTPPRPSLPHPSPILYSTSHTLSTVAFPPTLTLSFFLYLCTYIPNLFLSFTHDDETVSSVSSYSLGTKLRRNGMRKGDFSVLWKLNERTLMKVLI